MEILSHDKKCQEEKRHAEIIYKQIGRVWCPALNDFVIFNRTGFQHLLRKRGRRRTKHEKTRRFALLPFVENIIRNPNAEAQHEEKKLFYRFNQHGQKIKTSSRAAFWKLSEEMNGKTISVIVRKLNNGGKYFLSVYDN
jgi:hypothetical protein